MSDLKPCPFCGGEAHISKPQFVNGYVVSHMPREFCFAQGWQQYNTEAEAIEAWNTRATIYPWGNDPTGQYDYFIDKVVNK